MRCVTVDYVIVGAGVAGLTCALEACKTGSVILLSKSILPAGSTALAQGGIAAAIGSNDVPDLHFLDTVRAGGICDRKAVKVLVQEGIDRIKDIMDYGYPFDKDESGKPLLGREGAHSLSRVVSARGDGSGRALADTLINKINEKSNIFVYEKTSAVNLLVENKMCAGVCAVDFAGNPLIFRSSAVVLAAGGCGQLFSYTTNDINCTGEGYAMAYRAGTSLTGMEFVQFHPTALDCKDNPVFLISEAVRGKGAYLVDQNGQRFMKRYHMWEELAPRDAVARALFAEKQKGNQVFLDVSFLKNTFKEYFPKIYQVCREKGIDVPGEPIPVKPAAHFMMGGIKTDLYGYTGVKGLYACGESAYTGVHGANRLASNSLLEGLVFGYRVGQKIAKETWKPFVKEIDLEQWRNIRLHLPLEKNQHRFFVLKKIKEVMWQEVGLVRTGKGILHAINCLEEIKAALEDDDIVLKNMADIGGIIARSALARRESMGSHFRKDYPSLDMDNNFDYYAERVNNAAY
ncbi:MAG: L-aspartate oxidase [Clostridiales bacterium]|nr:L-aspartate oxidase [Clostridiales bacterium]MCF8023775.1 L-aspartate oxidase [Clostridiales bacterium]